MNKFWYERHIYETSDEAFRIVRERAGRKYVYWIEVLDDDADDSWYDPDETKFSRYAAPFRSLKKAKQFARELFDDYHAAMEEERAERAAKSRPSARLLMN